MPVSLGERSSGGTLTIKTLKVGHIEQTGNNGEHLQATHVALGDHATRNVCKLKQKGSIIYYEYTKHLQGMSLSTTIASTQVKITLAESHGLSEGDTVHISNSQNLPFSGIDASHLNGSFALEAGSSGRDIVVSLSTQAANQTANLSTFLCDCDCTIYKSMDMASDSTHFTRTTTEPAISYSNVAVA